MNGRTPTKAEKDHMQKTAELGCIICIKDGLIFPFTECASLDIHHINGSKKKNAHFLILPLLEQHHNYMHPGSRHHNKADWERRHGTERELWHHVQALIYPNGFPPEIEALLKLERWSEDYFDQDLYESFLQ